MSRLGSRKMDVAVTARIRAVALAHKVCASASTKVFVLRSVLDAEVAVRSEVGVLRLNTCQVGRLEVL